MEFSQSIDVSTEPKLSGRFHFAPVIHWINHYPADKFKNNQLRYPQWIGIYPVDRPQAPVVQKVDNAGGPTPYPLICIIFDRKKMPFCIPSITGLLRSSK